MTSLNDIPEDPRGFIIQPDPDKDGYWMWQRIADNKERRGYKSRETAIKGTETVDIQVDHEEFETFEPDVAEDEHQPEG